MIETDPPQFNGRDKFGSTRPVAVTSPMLHEVSAVELTVPEDVLYFIAGQNCTFAYPALAINKTP